jgi:galactose mutarotase-like enzyme
VSGEADFDGERACVLRADDGTEAWVVPSIGANCVALHVPLPNGGGTAHLLSTPKSAAALRGHPTGTGFPILSPHPGSNRAPFTWRGRTYQPPGGRERLAGHGFAAGAAWEVVRSDSSSLVCRLDTRTLDPAAAWWSWPFTLTATHRVGPGALTLSLELDNLAEDPAPIMFGLHPYFPLRFVTPRAVQEAGGPGGLPTAADLAGDEEAGARQSCRVWVEADTLWDLERGSATGASRPVSELWDTRRPRSLADLAETAVRAGVAQPGGRMPVLLYGNREALDGALAEDDPAAPGGVTSGVADTSSGLAMTLETSRAFGTVALYTPPAHAAVSLEPRSALPDALTLVAADARLPTGLRTVVPGRPWRAWARVSLAALVVRT